ncbi:ankyrin, partial [Anaeromyces robustus]
YKSKININEKDINGEYPLIKAFYQEKINIFEYLLSQGANHKIKNNNGVSLLTLALSKKKYDMIQCLLNQHIDINEKDTNGNYPIIKAIRLNDLKSVQLLMEYGINNNINMDITDINGSPPLILAYRLNFMEIFYYLIKFLDINKKDTNGNHLLFYTSLKNDIETTKFLIKVGSDINLKDKLGDSIFNKMLYNNNQDIMLELLNHTNLLLNEPNCRGETPLIISIKLYKSNNRYNNKYSDIINLLIEKGSNLNHIDKSGKSALVYAVSNGLSKITKLLIENGANINHHFGDNNISILIYAIQQNKVTIKEGYYGDIERIESNHTNGIIKYLIDNNADINYKDADGKSALIYSLHNNNDEISEYLINYGADVNIIKEKDEMFSNNDNKSAYKKAYKRISNILQ